MKDPSNKRKRQERSLEPDTLADAVEGHAMTKKQSKRKRSAENGEDMTIEMTSDVSSMPVDSSWSVIDKNLDVDGLTRAQKCILLPIVALSHVEERQYYLTYLCSHPIFRHTAQDRHQRYFGCATDCISA